MANNQKPAAGTPAGILETFQAANFLNNSTYQEAIKYSELFTQLARTKPALQPLAIVAVQTGKKNEGQTMPFTVLRSYGIKETDYLNLYIQFKGHSDLPIELNVGEFKETLRSAGNDAEGKPNYILAIFNLIEQIAPLEGITIQDVPSLLLNFEEIKAQTQQTLSAYFQ